MWGLRPQAKPLALLVVTALALTALTLAPAETRAENLRSTIPPQPLQTALATWAAQTHLQVAYLASEVGERRSPGAASGLAPDAALMQLLRGTGLQFEFLSSQLVRIRAASSALPVVAADAEPSGEEEIIVTARPVREASAASLSTIVWSQEALHSAHINDVARLADLTPGVTFASYQDYGSGIETNIAIRGVNARDGSTVAVYVDDIPIPTDRASQFGRAFPLLFDLDHVEVLRGPQGVLMGEGAEGGAIRLVRARPTFADFSAITAADYSTTDGGSPSYELSGEVGGPIRSDRLAFRLSAWSRRDGGYVDRVDWASLSPVEPNSNWTDRDTFSGELAFELTPRLSLSFAMDYQSTNVNDSSAFAIMLSAPEDGIFRNAKVQQPYLDRYRLPSMKLVADLGFARLVSETASFDRWASAVADFNASPQLSGPPLFGVGNQSLDQQFISEHLRLESTAPGRFEWMLGAAYIQSDYEEIQDLVTEAFAEQGNINGRLKANLGIEQLAAFGQSDIKLGDRLTATIGLRVEGWSYDSSSLIEARFHSNNAQLYLTTWDAATETAPRVSLSYRSSNRRTYYASAAKGYRMGGYNLPLGFECGTPTPVSYSPDTVWSYELGEKGSAFDGRLRDEVSLFHVSWRDLQLQIPYEDCGFGYTSNAGEATSDGIEFGVDADLFSHVSLKLTGAYVDARHTQTVYFLGRPVVQSGDAVGAPPLVEAPFSVNAIATYSIPVRAALMTLRAQDSYQSSNPGPFSTDHPDGLIYAPDRRPDPAFNQLDLSASVRWRSLSLSAFVLNALNAQPTLQMRNRVPGTVLYATTLRPKTIGISVMWQTQSSTAD